MNNPGIKLSARSFVIVDSQGRMIGTDQPSGGYPWRPSTLSGVKFWNTREEAEKYAAIFKREGFTVHDVFIDHSLSCECGGIIP